MTPETRHRLGNAIQVLEGVVALEDLTPAEFLDALKQTAAGLRAALKDEEETT